MSASREIPITPIFRRYRRLRKAPQAERLIEAEELLKYPEQLADEFAASVEHFSSYSNADEAFYGSRTTRVYADELRRTNDLVLRLEAGGTVVPTDHPQRSHHATGGVTNVRAEELAFDYVDRELLVQRTTSPARWEDGSRNVGGLRLDVLLVNVRDRTPAVGELKLPGDMDPFFALVQALACAAHLATPSQYERMRQHLPRGQFPPLGGAPPLDVFVLFVGQTKGTHQRALMSAAERLPARLLEHEQLSRFVRRIVGLATRVSEADGVEAEVLFAYGVP